MGKTYQENFKEALKNAKEGLMISFAKLPACRRKQGAIVDMN